VEILSCSDLSHYRKRTDDQGVNRLSAIRTFHRRSLVVLAAIFSAVAFNPASVAVGMQSPPAAAAPPTPAEEMPRYVGKILDPSQVRRIPRSVARRYVPNQVLSLDLRPVEQGIADRGPLDGGMRSIDSGLQMPSGYRQCFERPGGGFMRADGGLVATFDQSIYVQSRDGLLPDIPASTTFVIGGVPLAAEVGHGRLLPVDPLDPGRAPSAVEAFAPRVAPDEAWVVTAKPGDRIRRFGYGPGYRVAAEARPDPVLDSERHRAEPPDVTRGRAGDVQRSFDRGAARGPSRFFEDSSYRRDRMQALADSLNRGIRSVHSEDPVASTTEGIDSDRPRSAPRPHPRP
jgi:hypothetical protein